MWRCFGQYVLSALHDEDNNGELNTNFIGMPVEGVAASSNAQGKMGPPSYDEARF